MRKRLATALAAALLAAAPLARSAERLSLPAPLEFPQAVDTARVSAALLAACTEQKWIVEKDTGEAITAYRMQRTLRLHVRIGYDARSVSFEYLDSDNFHGQDAPDGGILIHRRANQWLESLGDEVQLQLQPILFERERATVVPVEPAPTPPGH